MKIKVGVIGVGTIAEMGHLPHYQKHPNVELVAVTDLDKTRAEQMAKKFNVRSVYQNAEEMLKEEKLDAVSICTPNVEHINLSLKAVNQGLDVLIEKPLGVSFEECHTLLKKVRENKRIGMVGMTHRYRNESQALNQIIRNDELGEIYYAKAQILRRRGTPAGWFTDASRSGGGTLMDIGVHALDLIWWLLGKPLPRSVSGHLIKGIGRYDTKMQSRWESVVAYNQNNEIFDVEDFASAMIRFRNDIVVNLESAWATNGVQDEGIKIHIFGSKGGVSLEPLVYYTETNGIFTEANIQIDRNDPYKTEIDHFIASVKEHKEPLSPVSDGVEIVRMLEGIKQSSVMKKEVQI